MNKGFSELRFYNLYLYCLSYVIFIGPNISKTEASVVKCFSANIVCLIKTKLKINEQNKTVLLTVLQLLYHTFFLVCEIYKIQNLFNQINNIE